MGQTISIARGVDRTWDSTLLDELGLPTPYPPEATLSATVWPGEDLPQSFAPAVVWKDPASATFRMSILSTQTAALDPAVYRLQVWVDNGGDRGLGFDGQLEITDAPGSATRRTPYVTERDLLLYYDQLPGLQNYGVDLAGFLDQRAVASDDFDRELINRYAPRAGFVRVRKPAFDPVLGFDVPDASITPPTKAELTAWLAAGGLVVDPVAREILCRRAIALILDRQETEGRNPYQDDAARQRAIADDLWMTHDAQLDADADGTPDWLIGLDATQLPAGAKP